MDKIKTTKKKGNERRKKKQTYQKPSLIRYGTLTELTQGSNTGKAEAAGGPKTRQGGANP